MVVMLSTQCLRSKIIWAYHRGAFNQDNMSSVIPSTEEGQSGSDQRCRRQKRASKDGEWRETAELLPHVRVTVRCKLQRRLPTNVKVMLSQRSQQTLEYKDLNV